VVPLHTPDFKTLILKFQNEIQNPLAVRSPVDHVSEEIEFVAGFKPDYLRNQPPEGAAAAMDVWYYEATVYGAVGLRAH
jgi:hypothetical protein